MLEQPTPVCYAAGAMKIRVFNAVSETGAGSTKAASAGLSLNNVMIPRKIIKISNGVIFIIV